MSHALSALHQTAMRWFRQTRLVRRPRSMAKDPVPPTAQYDPVALAFTCPHCGQSLPIFERTLIEPGYERYWSLNPPLPEDFGRVTASDDRFSDHGDDGPARLVHESHDCYRDSLVPANFEWDWD